MTCSKLMLARPAPPPLYVVSTEDAKTTINNVSD